MDNDQVAVGQDDEQAQNAMTAEDAGAGEAAPAQTIENDDREAAQNPEPTGEPDVAQVAPAAQTPEPEAQTPEAEAQTPEPAAQTPEPAAEAQEAAESQGAESQGAEQAPAAAAEAPEAAAGAPESAAKPAAAEQPGLEDLKPGSTMRGKVRNIVDFGAFIDIGVGRDGLAHVSTLKRAGIDKTLKVGDEIDVVVRRVDTDANRISLTVPRAEREVKASLSSIEVGSVVTGKVMRLVDFGAFIDIGAPTDGLLHISQLGGGFVNHPSEVLNVGDELQVRVLEVDVERRRISLTMRDVALDAAEGEGAPAAAASPARRQAPPREGQGRSRRPRGQGRGRAPEGEQYSPPEEPAFPTAIELAFQQALADKKRKQRRSRA